MEAFINYNCGTFLPKNATNILKTPENKNIFLKNQNSRLVRPQTMMMGKKNYDLFVKSSIGFSFLFYPLVSQAVPDAKPTANIYDESGALTKSSISYLEKAMQKVKEVNGTNVYFVSVRSLPFETEPEQYAQELFQKWDLGEKDVIVVLANKIARAGIFSGNGITTLTKEMAKSIGEETYPFKAKEEQYSSAALDVSNRLVSILSNKGDPGPPTLVRENSSSNFKSAKATEQQRSKYVAIIIILLVVAFVVPMVQFFYYVKDE